MNDVTVRFGGITALDHVSFSVGAGTIVGLIGPNGAGKTTLFNCLSRLYTYSEGDIRFEGRTLTDTPAHGIAALGIGRTFQNLALFRTMSVRQNVLLGGHTQTNTGYLANALRLPRADLLKISPPGARHLTGLGFSEAQWQALRDGGARHVICGRGYCGG